MLQLYLEVSVRREEPCKGLQEGGFAGGGWPQQKGHPAGLQDPADALQDAQALSLLPPQARACQASLHMRSVAESLASLCAQAQA